jgi:hypothetical protein
MPDFPQRGQEIIDALYAQNTPLATGTLDQQRLLTRLIGEQMAFEFGPRWGIKAAATDRPIGPSEIAFNAPPLFIWRWSDGDGHVTGLAGSPLHPPLLEPLDQTAGQVFIRCDPIDHLNVSTTTPSPRPAPSPAPVTDIDHLMAIVARLNALETRVAMLSDHVVSVDRIADEALHRPYPRYVAKWFGITIVSKPEGS